jgi:L-iditol 2-dehydrogenase
MLAYVWHGPDDLRLERVPRPLPRSGEALLRVEAAGICGTDLRIAHGQHAKYGAGTIRVPGHEVAGTIVAAGKGADLPVDRRVFVAPNWGCGLCRECRAGYNNLCTRSDAIGITVDGAFAEYMTIPAAAVTQGNVLPLADALDTAAAALAEPFAAVLRGQEAVGVKRGDVVLVAGAGPIGIMHLLLAKHRGAWKVIVSQRPGSRADLAAQFGADRVVSPIRDELATAVAEETDGRGADVIFIAAPSAEAQEQAIELAAARARINFFAGLPNSARSIALPSNSVHYKELVITGTTACSTDDCRHALALLVRGDIELSALISERYPLQRAPEALISAADHRLLKVILALELGDNGVRVAREGRSFTGT